MTDQEAASPASVPDDVAGWTAATDKLREVVKWVAAAFGTLGALLIGTAPLSSIADADFGLEFVVAVVFGLAALASVGFIFWQCTTLLVPEPLELSDLSAPDYAELRLRIARHPVDYLGSQGRTFEEFQALRAQDRAHLMAVDLKYVTEQDPARRESLLVARKLLIARMEASSGVRARLLAWGDFQKLRTAFEAARRKMFLAAVLAAIGITGFHVAASAAVPDPPPSSTTAT